LGGLSIAITFVRLFSRKARGAIQGYNRASAISI
jgi:hypothetical protein